MRGAALPILGASSREDELARQGWVRRFTGAPPRLEEMVELYRDIGLEVHLEPISPAELNDECGECRLALSLFRTLYTRRQS